MAKKKLETVLPETVFQPETPNKMLETPLLVDAYQKARQERLDLDKRVANLKETETMYKELIIQRMVDSGQHVLSSKRFSLKLGRSDEPTMKDWAAFDDYVITNRRLDLLHRRITSTAIKAMWENGEEVPGVISYPVFDISISKLM